jgi:hypothetical protein
MPHNNTKVKANSDKNSRECGLVTVRMCLPELTVHTHSHTRIHAPTHVTVYCWAIGYWGRDRVLSVMARVPVWTNGKFRFDCRKGHNSFILQCVQIDFRANTSTYSMGIGGLFLPMQSGTGVKQTTQFHIGCNSGMGGAVLPLLHVTCTEIIPLLFTRYHVGVSCK